MEVPSRLYLRRRGKDVGAAGRGQLLPRGAPVSSSDSLPWIRKSHTLAIEGIRRQSQGSMSGQPSLRWCIRQTVDGQYYRREIRENQRLNVKVFRSGTAVRNRMDRCYSRRVSSQQAVYMSVRLTVRPVTSIRYGIRRLDAAYELQGSRARPPEEITT